MYTHFATALTLFKSRRTHTTFAYKSVLHVTLAHTSPSFCTIKCIMCTYICTVYIYIKQYILFFFLFDSDIIYIYDVK